jgi:uncharacterized protein
VIDACAHPVVRRPTDISSYIADPYKMARFAPPALGPHPMAGSAYVAGSSPADGTLPGSDPVLFEQQVLNEPGADFAVLVPLGRGLLGDVSLACAVDEATNQWMSETWLGPEYNGHGRYRGSIRVTPRSPTHAVREIERWGEDPHFTQVVVPLESLTPYGEPDYFRIWEAAAKHDLPIAIHSDHNVGIAKSFAIGQAASYLEQYTQLALYAITHVDTLIAFGVFDRLPSLRVVLADGGFDYFQTLMWRVDKDHRGSSSEVPLITGAPSDYMIEHVRIVIGASDGRADPEAFRRFIEVNDGLGDMLIYGSNYPSWDHLAATDLVGSLPADRKDAIMDSAARQLYRLPVVV